MQKEMLKKVYIFMNAHGDRFRSPVFNGDKAEYATNGRGDECRITWAELDEMFNRCNTYSDFVKTSASAQCHYRASYIHDSPCPQTTKRLRIDEPLDVTVNETVYIIENRDRHGKRDFINRMNTLARLNRYRGEALNALNRLPAKDREGEAHTPRLERLLNWLEQNAQLTAVLAVLLVEDNDNFCLGETEFDRMHILNGCLVKQTAICGRIEEALYNDDGCLMAHGKQSMLPNLPCFVSQKQGYGEDDYYGTMYIPRNKAMTSFFAVPYSC